MRRINIPACPKISPYILTMSVSNLNEFPLHEISTNMNTIKFSLVIVGIVKFLLVQILLHRKRISLFFTALRSPMISESHNLEDDSMKKKIDVVKKFDDGSVCGGEVEIVLRSLGIFGQEKLPARLGADEIFEIFEEREPSLGEVREAFRVFDENRDGFIDEKELQKVLCALGFREGLEMENCRRMIGAFDEDGDGRIDFHEFVKFMENSFT